MKKASVAFLILVPCLAIAIALAGCGSDDDTSTGASDTALIDKSVTIAAEGGSEEVSFSADKGQSVRITLTAEGSMQPYGFLTKPDGRGEYLPEEGMAQNGVNTAEVGLDQAGEYMLTVFDSSNLGGTIKVRIEVL